MKKSAIILMLVLGAALLILTSTSHAFDPRDGFHISIGAGPSSDLVTNGIGTQFKIGYTWDKGWRLYYYSLAHTYYSYFPEYNSKSKTYEASNQEDDVFENWAKSVQGVGFDYFFSNRGAFRFALGIGTDMQLSEEESHTDAKDDMDDKTPFKDESIYGMGWAWGFSIVLVDGNPHSMSLDPMMAVLWTVPEDQQHIASSQFFTLSLNYNFR